MKKFIKIFSVFLVVLMCVTSMYEPLAVFAQTPDEIYESVKTMPPTLSADGSEIILPEIPDVGYELKLYGSSNESVIGLDGTIYPPLEDMTVTVMYQLVNKNDPADKIVDNFTEVSIIVPGKYTNEQSDNAKPKVVPGLREWKGHTGYFTLTENSRIVIADETLLETAESIAFYFSEMLKRDIAVVTGVAQAGDIYLTFDKNKAELGKEGYEIEIADTVTVTAYNDTGVLYAGTSLTQILFQDEAKSNLPKGLIRDYPQYEVRSFGFEVARFYYPIEYIEEITKYLAYYKMNEAHIHLNDDAGEQTYAFRLESKKYPEINSSLNPDEVWTQEEYKAYQKEVAKYGVSVVSEIDSPAHAGFVYLHNPSYMLPTNSTWIDLENEDAKAFFKDVIAEFVSGDDPVIQGDKFNIGTDEYDKNKGELVLQWTNELIGYVKELMGEDTDVRMWAALGEGGFQGETKVRNDVTVGHWSSTWADPVYMLDEGYGFINNYDRILYLVPGVQTGYQNYLDMATAYNTWEVNKCEITIPEANPLLRGAEAFMWYGNKVGASEFDVFDRARDWTALVAEKCWCGSEKDGTVKDFVQRFESIDIGYVPGANPARYVDSIGETVASYDFEILSGTMLTDSSGNGYDATVTNLTLAQGEYGNALKLDGSGSLSLPFDSIGFPYTVSFDLYIDSTNPKDAVLFSGGEGTLYLNFEGKGKIAYQRKGYTYVLDHVLETGKWQKITLSCDELYLALAINDEMICTGEYLYDKPQTTESWGVYLNSAKYFDSSTFVLPVKNIGGGVSGMIDNLTIKNTCEFSVGNLPTWLSFTPQDLTLVDNGTGWWRWTNTGTVPTTAPYYGMVVGGGGYNAGPVDSILIRSFTVPEDGTLTIRSTGADYDITAGNDTTHDRFPTQYAIADATGKIVYPLNGNYGTVSYSMPIKLPEDDTLTFTVKAGDVYHFIMKDNTEVAMPGAFKAAVSVNGKRYDDNGMLQGASYVTQGENGWHYQYATDVTESHTAPEVVVKPKALKFTAKNMVLLGDGTGFARWADTVTNYKIHMSTGPSYTTGYGYASINKFVVPEGTTKIKIDTKYTTGITMGNSASDDIYPIKYAITDKNGKILFPTNGTLGTVTYSNPVAIDEQLIFDVKAGDEFNFILINDFGGNLPMTFKARVLNQNDTDFDFEGKLRTQNFNTQGEGGWYYQYATSVVEEDYVEEIIPTTTISYHGGMVQWDAYAPDRMMDGSETSWAWCQKQAAGQYVQFTFNTPRILNSISVLTAASGDVMGAADFQVSLTGEDGDWVTVAQLASTERQTVSFTPVRANYARIYITEPNPKWLKLYEVVIGETDRLLVDGDVNGDGNLDADDIFALRIRLLDKENNESFTYDVNGDDVVDVCDLVSLALKLGMPAEL